MLNLKKSSYGLTLLGAVVGAIAGFFYYREVGCTSQGCFISSHPLITTAYGALVFGLFASGIKKPGRQEKSSSKTDKQPQL